MTLKLLFTASLRPALKGQCGEHAGKMPCCAVGKGAPSHSYEKDEQITIPLMPVDFDHVLLILLLLQPIT